MFNVVGLKDVTFFDTFLGSGGNGIEGSETWLLEMEAVVEEGVEECLSIEDNSCLTSCDVDGRLMVIVGNAGGTRTNGNWAPRLSEAVVTVKLHAGERDGIVKIGSGLITLSLSLICAPPTDSTLLR